MTYFSGVISTITDGKVEYKFVRDNVNDEVQYKVKDGNNEHLLVKATETPTSQTLKYYRNNTSTATDTITLNYDNYGNVITEKYDGATKVTYTYDNEKIADDDSENKASGSTRQVRQIVDGYTERTVKYKTDVSGNVVGTETTDSSGNKLFSVEKVGAQGSKYTVGDVTVTQSVISSGNRINEITYRVGNGDYINYYYAHDSYGRVTIKSINELPLVAKKTIEYSDTSIMPETLRCM